MQRIEFDEWTEGSVREDEDGTCWDCTVCGRPRLCPYAAPRCSDSREACRSCGDLLAHICNSTARDVVSNLEDW